MRIGIDIGNVIIGGGGEDTFFTDSFLETDMVEGARASLEALAVEGHELHFVSKCGKSVEEKTIEWLYAYKFEYILDFHRIHFVRKRPLKAPMAQALELQVFIDDREDIIESMQGVVKYPILFTSWEQTNRELKAILPSTKS